MPVNASGQYSRLYSFQQDAVSADATIKAAKIDAEIDGIIGAFNSLTNGAVPLNGAKISAGTIDGGAFVNGSIDETRFTAAVQARLTPTGATDGQYLKWNGTRWVGAAIQTPDGSISTDKLADGTITAAKLGTSLATRILPATIGASGQVLTSDGTTATWQALPETPTPPMVAGTIEMYAGTATPHGYLPCNGALVSRTTYADLYAAIGTMYGAGDGSTSFAIPDLRGEFLRGWDAGRGVDSGRSIGSTQADELKSHSHNILNNRNNSVVYAPAGGVVGGISNSVPSGNSSHEPYGRLVTDSIGSHETRPRNLAINFVIKY